jgi:hypothetical protein
LKYFHLYCRIMAACRRGRRFGAVLLNARVDGIHRVYDVCKRIVVYHFAIPSKFTSSPHFSFF